MSTDKRQHVEKVPGSRRAKLTPAPGTAAEPGDTDDETDATAGPNDERLRGDVPPHY